MQSIRVVALVAFCCLVGGALSACALHAVEDASWSDGIPRKRVSYAGLDLNSAAGAGILLHRLKAAAWQVCAPLDGSELAQHRRWRACYTRALAEAVRQVNHPMVTAQYQASVPTAMLSKSGAAP